MKKSAMMQAFRVLKEKPMVLLLILPVQALSALSMKFMPDMSGFFNLSNPTGGMDQQFMTSYMIFMFFSSMMGLVSLAAAFLLTPPAMELFMDGAAGRRTEDGWYMRGLRKHWWKPIVSQLIVSVPVGIVAFGIYIVSLVLLVVMVPMLSFGASGMVDPSSTEGMGIAVALATGLLIAGAILLAVLVIQSFFALFLPALADRSFGAAFKLLFTRKGLRKFFRALGGLLILTLVPLAVTAVLGAAYVALKGLPVDAMGALSAMLGFLRSWTGVLAMLLSSLTGVVVYAFEFCLYQQVKEEEEIIVSEGQL